ncbi:MAG: septum formation initiator family protein [Patescibacteria group bacterium]
MITNFNKKQKSNTLDSFLSSLLVKLFFIIIIVLLITADIKVYKDRKKLTLQINNLKEKIQAIQKKNNTLEYGIARADDKDYIEKIAREELDLQIKNEKVITFITPKLEPKEEINPSSNFLNLKTWLGWVGNSWQWILNLGK